MIRLKGLMKYTYGNNNSNNQIESFIIIIIVIIITNISMSIVIIIVIIINIERFICRTRFLYDNNNNASFTNNKIHHQ